MGTALRPIMFRLPFGFLLISMAYASLDAQWDVYVKKVLADAPHGLQQSCMPRRFKPTKGVTRGLAVLFHGYSACPQQFDELSPLLADQGFEVLVPLIPGMGNNFNSSGPLPARWQCPLDNCNGPLDDVTGMPTEPEDYIQFVAQINAIAQETAVPRVVMGISVGASIAAYAGQTVFNGAALYDRQLILNPMLDGANKVQEEALRALNLNEFTRDHLWLGWGVGCRHERSLGRGGVCTFKVDNCMAAADFGLNNTLHHLAMPTNTSVAVVYDQGDPVVDTTSVRQLVTKYKAQVTAGSVQSCLLNFTLHSMLSKWDNRGVNRWWMNELYCDMVNYLANDQPFILDAAINKTEGDEHYCHLGCTAESCRYNWSAPITCPFAPPKLEGGWFDNQMMWRPMIDI